MLAESFAGIWKFVACPSFCVPSPAQQGKMRKLIVLQKNITMEKFLIFMIGLVTGIVATFLVLSVIYVANEPNDGLLGLTMFSEKGECITTDGEIEVFRVIEPNMALAKTVKYGDYGFRKHFDEIVVLLIDYDGKTFYDGQKVKIPTNKCAR